ncbi:MAG: Hpt domain-containing protein, partial [Pseudomonadota bacterium]|nr:Hpt domain-containing protein [Pseudomonadota bacterium]
MSELLDVFIGESRENLESASQELLEIQSSGPASERVDKIFRDLHTIKGSSDLFDIKPLTRLAHAAEDLLDSVRSNEVTYSDDIGDLLLEALDQISIWFDELEVGSQNVEQWKPISTQLSAQLRHFIDPTASSEVDESSATVNNESPIADPQTLSEEHIALIANFGRNADLDLLCKATGPDCYFIQYTPDEGCFFRGEDPINVTVALPGIKAFNIEMPELGEDADIYNCFTSIKALGVASEDEIKQHMAYYEGQYSCVSFSTQALKAACTGKIQKCVETIDDETLNSALNDTDIDQVHASAGLLLASLNFDDSEDGSANRAVLSLLSSIDDLSFLDNEIREDGCSGKDTNMNTSPEVGNSSTNEARDSRREASKPKTLALHER